MFLMKNLFIVLNKYFFPRFFVGLLACRVGIASHSMIGASLDEAKNLKAKYVVRLENRKK